MLESYKTSLATYVIVDAATKVSSHAVYVYINYFMNFHVLGSRGKFCSVSEGGVDLGLTQTEETDASREISFILGVFLIRLLLSVYTEKFYSDVFTF